jgi:ATP-dependent DNA helicase RecG
MGLPINIDDLINSRTVESNRIEFKRGWNPEDIMHSMCAFSNDFQEEGGGYIIVGIEADNGVPVLPPSGLELNQLDRIQNEFLRLCHLISPHVLPVIQLSEFGGENIVVIWVTPGEERPYNAPVSLGKNAQRRVYIRVGSATIEAKGMALQRLHVLAANRAFDDRINREASVEDLSMDLIADYLNEIDSDLVGQLGSASLDDISQKMQIVRGPEENRKPLNVALLCFSKDPERFFGGCFTNLVEFEDMSGTRFSDVQFRGPVPNQIKSVMDYLRNNTIRRFTTKTSASAAAKEFYNYPFQALEEAVTNALYHRSYEEQSPTEIRIYKQGNNPSGEDRHIEVISYPGPLPPVDEIALAALSVTARNYRNTRLGDFLKNLRLAEKYGTGIPTMVNSLKKNGSPKPVLTTDSERTYFSVAIYIHPETPLPDSQNSTVETPQLTDIQQQILDAVLEKLVSRQELERRFRRTVRDELQALVEFGFIASRVLGKATYYHVTEKGLRSLKSSF